MCCIAYALVWSLQIHQTKQCLFPMSQPSDVNCHYTLYIIHYILTILHLKSVFLLWKWNMFGHNKKRNKIIESFLRCLAALGQMDGDPGAEQLECPGDDKETQKRGPGRPRSEKYTEVISRTSHETYASYRKALQKQYENNWTLAIDIFFWWASFYIIYFVSHPLYIYIHIYIYIYVVMVPEEGSPICGLWHNIATSLCH